MILSATMHHLAELDHRYIWHPFTQMRDWLRQEPILITEGKGALLRDVHGREYLDANASIWTNLHGHNHPKINAAITRQLRKIAHSSALGFANEPASLLAEKLVQAANPGKRSEANAECRVQSVEYSSLSTLHSSLGEGAMRNEEALPIADCRLPNEQNTSSIEEGAGIEVPEKSQISNLKSQIPSQSAIFPPYLAKVFYSDDGSTAMEVALKLAYEYTRRCGRTQPPRFLSLANAYHGDTIGAVSLGHIDLFHKTFSGLLFESDQVMAPYCYRCPYNKAKPERSDARTCRQCQWECIDQVEQQFAVQQQRGNPYAGMVIEPLMQGAAGMIPQPAGWLSRVSDIVRANQALLIADEVMTGFGRTGCQWPTREHPSPQTHQTTPAPTEFNASTLQRFNASPRLFACHGEGVQPDLLAVAKGLTGGYLPMAATLATQTIFDAFLGEYSEFKTFFHGHSFTGNQLGSAAALASMDLLVAPAAVRARRRLQQAFTEELQHLWSLPAVGDIRQVGLVAGVELVKNWHTRQPCDLSEQAGIRVCAAMARRGVLTRPIGSVIVLMPPYCTTLPQLRKMVTSLREAIEEVLSLKRI